jgi:uncharacterized membrane protein YfcA
MLFGIAYGDLLWLAAAIVAGGLVTGTLSGLFGIGGGGVIVPVLYEVFRALGVPEEVRMQLCVGTSLGIIVPTNFRSFLAHRARGAVLMDVVRLWAVPAIVGVAVGSLVAAFAPAAVLKIAFVVIAAVISFKLLVGGDTWRIAAQLPGQPLTSLYGFGVGLGSSLMGISGGSMATMVLTLYGTPILNAVATSAGLGVPITMAGVIGYMLAGWRHAALLPPLSIGFVSLIGVLLMAPIASLAAPYGARLAHALPRRRLEIAFGIFLLLVSLRFLASLVI